MVPTLPLMMPLPRERRAGALFECGLELSFIPSAPLGVDNLPPMFTVGAQEVTNVELPLLRVNLRYVVV